MSAGYVNVNALVVVVVVVRATRAREKKREGTKRERETERGWREICGNGGGRGGMVRERFPRDILARIFHKSIPRGTPFPPISGGGKGGQHG